MNILILNSGGNVGKTTIATKVLLPNLQPAKFVDVETFNMGATAQNIDTIKMRGNNFRDLFINLLSSKDTYIIDVGASNVLEFMKQLQTYGASVFDYIVVPTTPGTKEQTDTVNVLLTLKNLKIDPSRVKIILNKYTSLEISDLEEEYSTLSEFLLADGYFKWDPSVSLRDLTEFLVNLSNYSIEELISDPISVDSVRSDSEKDPVRASELSNKLWAKLNAEKVADALNKLFVSMNFKQQQKKTEKVEVAAKPVSK